MPQKCKFNIIYLLFFVVLSHCKTSDLCHMNQDFIISLLHSSRRLHTVVLNELCPFLASFRVTVSSQASLQTSIAPRRRLQLRGRLPPAFLLFLPSCQRRSRDLQPTSSSPRRLSVTFSWAPWGSISPGIYPCIAGGWTPTSRRPRRPAWGPSTATE